MTTNDAPAALVTGGGTGIGAAVARHLLDAGWRVTVTGRTERRLREFADGLGNPEELQTVAGDASAFADVQHAVDRTLTAYGRLDTVVANAGFATHDTVADGDPAGWAEMVLTNVLGPALLIPRLRRRAEGDPRADRPRRQRRRVREHARQSLRGDQVGRHRSRREHQAAGHGVRGRGHAGRPRPGGDPFWDGYGSLPLGHLLTADQIADSVVLGDPAAGRGRRQHRRGPPRWAGQLDVPQSLSCWR